MSEPTFQPGDVVLLDGETYQVLEPMDAGARVVPFPADDVAPVEIAWAEAGEPPRRIGQAPLPAPTPCSADGCCPTGGNPVADDEIKPPG
jgi:hypothetical protein